MKENGTMTLSHFILNNFRFILATHVIFYIAVDALTDNTDSFSSDDEDDVNLIPDRIRVNHYSNTFFITKAGAIIPTLSGSISAISSFLIMFIIFKSREKLSTAYHRILLGMSFSDFISSIGIAFTTLPMPKDDPFITFYNFEWPRLGNTATCEAQGFLIFLGGVSSFSYSVALSVYYLCTIRYKMKEDKMRKYVEPPLHIMSILFGIFPSATCLAYGMYNPFPYSSHCYTAVYPWWCTEDELHKTTECRGDGKEKGGFIAWVEVILPFFFITMLLIMAISMFLICWNVYQQDRLIARYERKARGKRKQANNTNNSRKNLEHTKIITRQALAYVAIFLLTWSIPFVRVMGEDESHLVQALYLLLSPLQGFFNFLLFVYHKIRYIREADARYSILSGFLMLLKNPVVPDVLISRISMVKDNEKTNDSECFNEENDPNLSFAVTHSDGDISYDKTKASENISKLTKLESGIYNKGLGDLECDISLSEDGEDCIDSYTDISFDQTNAGTDSLHLKTSIYSNQISSFMSTPRTPSSTNFALSPLSRQKPPSLSSLQTLSQLPTPKTPSSANFGLSPLSIQENPMPSSKSDLSQLPTPKTPSSANFGLSPLSIQENPMPSSESDISQMPTARNLSSNFDTSQ